MKNKELFQQMFEDFSWHSIKCDKMQEDEECKSTIPCADCPWWNLTVSEKH